MTEEPQTTNTTATATHTELPAPSPWVLLKAFLGLICLGVSLGIVLILVRLCQTVDMRSIYVGLDGLRTPIAAGLACLLSIVAAVVWFRPRRKTMVITCFVVVGVSCIGRSLFRIESFYGNMIPRLTWRWTPTVEERFDQYLFSVTSVSNSDSERTLNAAGLHPILQTDFAGFLGNDRNGAVSDVSLSDQWDQQQPRQLWRHPIGLGWSGFAVVGKQAITQEQRGNVESIVCYDLNSGKQIWSYNDPVRFCDEHGDGPRTTPSITEQHVFCMGATGVLTCLNRFSGTLVWRHETLGNPEEKNLLWGMSGSTLLMDDLVIVTPGAGSNKAIMAFRQSSGEPIWSRGNDTAAYASPATAILAGHRQILSFNGVGLRGYDEQGRELWLHPWVTQGESQRVNIAQPLVVSPKGLSTEHCGYAVVSSGYGVGTAMLRITLEGDRWVVDELWKSKQLKSKMSNFVIHGDFVFGLDNGILTCLKLADGKKMWKQGRYGHGQILLVEDKLLIQAESGEVALVAAASTEFRELGRFEALSDKTWNHAALAGNILIVRNDREAAAYELPLRNETGRL